MKNGLFYQDAFVERSVLLIGLCRTVRSTTPRGPICRSGHSQFLHFLNSGTSQLRKLRSARRLHSGYDSVRSGHRRTSLHSGHRRTMLRSARSRTMLRDCLACAVCSAQWMPSHHAAQLAPVARFSAQDGRFGEGGRCLFSSDGVQLAQLQRRCPAGSGGLQLAVLLRRCPAGRAVAAL